MVILQQNHRFLVAKASIIFLFLYIYLEKCLTELESYLTKQNYPKGIINAGLQRAMQLNRETLRTVKEKIETDIIPYVSTFN